MFLCGISLSERENRFNFNGLRLDAFKRVYFHFIICNITSVNSTKISLQTTFGLWMWFCVQKHQVGRNLVKLGNFVGYFPLTKVDFIIDFNPPI